MKNTKSELYGLASRISELVYDATVSKRGIAASEVSNIASRICVIADQASDAVKYASREDAFRAFVKEVDPAGDSGRVTNMFIDWLVCQIKKDGVEDGK